MSAVGSGEQGAVIAWTSTSCQLYERLEPGDAFSIRGVAIPAGRYNTVSWRISTRTASQRPVSGRVTISGGEFWSGTRSAYDVSLSVRPMPGMGFGTRFNRNNIHLPGGDFTTTLGSLSGSWPFNPWAALSGNV